MLHNETCKMAFGRPSKHNTCPRCEELKAGAKPRNGWNTSYNYQMRVGKGPHYDAFVRRLKSHDCKQSNCGPVCTAFDY